MKVFFLDTVHPILKERLTKVGFECVDAIHFSIEDLLAHKDEINGLVVRARILLQSSFLSQLQNLKFIARSGSGLENIDVNYCKEQGVFCFNSPEGNKNAVAEHTLAMLLSLMNNISFANDQIKQGIWKREENRGEELDGKTIGIIGFGNNGSAFAKKLRGFEVKILAYDKYKQGFGDAQVQECTLEAIFMEADVLSLHIPQNKETLGMVNDDFISAFHKPFYFLNLSRGKIVQTEALVRGIQQNKIKAVGLDVLEYESKDFESIFSKGTPTALNELIQSKKVLLTPHVGGWSKESYFKLSDVLADKIIERFSN